MGRFVSMLQASIISCKFWKILGCLGGEGMRSSSSSWLSLVEEGLLLLFFELSGSCSSRFLGEGTFGSSARSTRSPPSQVNTDR